MDYIITGLAIVGLITLAILVASFFTRPRYESRQDEDDIGNWIDRLKI